jgi:tRNA U34 5-methylaminomethyl-2-thiouridine-forming methyltransferase MnmC
MSIQRIVTADGSHTLWNDTLNAYYHSVNGALQESQCIYIELGLKKAMECRRTLMSGGEEQPPLCIFEMGFGTGLNALLTWLEAEKAKIPIYYVAVEAYPLAEWVAGNQPIVETSRSGVGKTRSTFSAFYA